MEILEGHMMIDHVHLLVAIPPRISVSSFMGYLKGKSALMMFEHFCDLLDRLCPLKRLDKQIIIK